jgi:hypothetical protein
MRRMLSEKEVWRLALVGVVLAMAVLTLFPATA